MDNCATCQPDHLCAEHYERDFQRMKGVVYRRADEWIETVRTRRPTTAELQLEAAHRVRDLASDPRLQERFAAEFICWIAVRSTMAR